MTKSLVRRLCAAVLFLMLVAGAVHAQQEAPAGEAATAAPPKESKVTLFQLWKTGGWAMYPIGLLSVAAVGLTVFCFINYREEKMLHPELIGPLTDSVQQLDFRAASTLCAGTPSILTNILGAGLMRLRGGSLSVASVEKAMEEAAVEENTVGLRPINYLSIIATIAPMCGLLGTVSGMIKAFQKIGLGGMGDPERLASDIGEAMVTTAFGLLVGIPAMFFYFYLKSRFVGTMSRLGRVLGNLTNEMLETFQRVQDGELSLDGFTAPAAPGTAPQPASQPAPEPVPETTEQGAPAE